MSSARAPQAATGLNPAQQRVVTSPREVAVTLHFAVASYTGYFTYPVALIVRR